MHHYITDINNRPFQAIKAGTKKIEGRTITSWETIPLKQLKKGDLLTFINNTNNEKITVIVTFVHHYPSVEVFLQTETISDVLSSFPKTIAHGVASYNQITGYREAIPIHGIYAIGVALIQ